MMPFKKTAKGKKTIVFVGSEGWSKKGGQGDYIRELSEALSHDGHLTLVVNPYFRQPHADISDAQGKHLFSLDLPMGQGSLPFAVYHHEIHKVHYLRFKDVHEVLYPVVYPDWDINGTLYSDSLYGYMEAVALSRIPMHIMMKLGVVPDIVHFNDWQSAYGPAYMAEIYQRHSPFKSFFKKTGTVFTVHNMAYQGLTKWGLHINSRDPINRLLEKIYPSDGLFIGVFDHGFGHYEVDTFGITGFPRNFQYQTEGGAECWSALPGCGGRHNVLKFGLEKADKIVAVSKGNRQEIQRDDLGFGLGGLVERRAAQEAVDYVWNGVDVKRLTPGNLNELTETLNPSTGVSFIPFRADDLNLVEKRTRNKIAVRSKVNHLVRKHPESCFGNLDEKSTDGILVSAVSRLVRQKGYGILFERLHDDYELDIHEGERLADVFMRLRGPKGDKPQLVVMGTPGDGDGAWVAEELKWLAWQYGGQVAFIQKFDPALANQIRAGSDLFFMPSQYEPGGITNIQAAVLGALCLITYTGGLIDFLENGGTHPEFVAAPFDYDDPWSKKRTARDFVRAFRIASNIYHHDKIKWQGLVRKAMALKADWSNRVPKYLSIYDAAQKIAAGSR